MPDKERNTNTNDMDEDLKELKERVGRLEDRMAQKDTEFAVINTKLSAILWGVGVIGTALIGVLVKMLFGA